MDETITPNTSSQNGIANIYIVADDVERAERVCQYLLTLFNRALELQAPQHSFHPYHPEQPAWVAHGIVDVTVSPEPEMAYDLQLLDSHLVEFDKQHQALYAELETLRRERDALAAELASLKQH